VRGLAHSDMDSQNDFDLFSSELWDEQIKNENKVGDYERPPKST
jgi:hypothetical protein